MGLKFFVLVYCVILLLKNGESKSSRNSWENSSDNLYSKLSEPNSDEVEVRDIEKFNIFLKTLTSDWNATCQNSDTLLIQGDIVKFSAIVEESNNRLIDFCPGQKIRSVKVFSWNTVVFDRSLIAKGQNFSFTIIAPRWIVEGTDIKIDLRGADGEAIPGHPWSYVPEISGLPGKSGGTFYGIGDEFINSVNLKIDVSGGSGGPGRESTYTKTRRDIGPNSEDSYRDLWSYSTNELWKNGPLCINEVIRLPDYSGPKYRCKVHGYKKNGKTLHSGLIEVFGMTNISKDHGGENGLGGNPGDLSLVSLGNTPDQISKIQDLGERDVNAINTHQGSRIKIQFQGNAHSAVMTFSITNDVKVFHDRFELPENGLLIPRSIKASVINEAKTYLRRYLTDRLKKPLLMKFLTLMEENSEIIKVYDAAALLEDLRGLEEQTHVSSQELVPFYKSLMIRINDYSLKTNESKKALAYLYTSTLSRIYNLDDEAPPTLIIKILDYLKMVKVNIDALKGLENKRDKLMVSMEKISQINHYSGDYGSDIVKKLQEAEDFIKNQIEPELDVVGDKINKDLDTLVTEVIQLQEKTHKEEKDLIKKREELQKQMVMKSVFGVLKVVSGVACAFGPVGIAVGAIAGTTTTVTESLLVGNGMSDPGEIFSKAKIEFDRVKVAVKSIQEAEVVRMDKMLSQVYSMVRKVPKAFDNMAEEVVNMRKNLQSVKNLDQVKSIGHRLKTRLVYELKGYEENPRRDDETKQAIRYLGACVMIADASKGIVDTWIQYKDSANVSEGFITAIGMKKQQYQDLKGYEESIHTEIRPMLNRIKKSVEDVADGLNNQSQSVLEVTRWKLARTLKQTKSLMEKMFDKFSVKGSLVTCIQNFMDAMDTLINVHSTMENHRRDKSLGDYIANIARVSANDYPFDNQLALNLTEVEMKIGADLVSKQHRMAINAFKLYAFPFAHIYFRDIPGLFVPVQIKDRIEYLIPKVSKEIGLIIKKMVELNSTISKHDDCTIYGVFNNNSNYTLPFFTWNSESHRNSISQLLAGKEVTMRANILKSGLLFFDAVKFNSIKVAFTSKNKTAEKRINELLKAFQVSLTHMGDSYYQYHKKFYLITTDVQNVRYAFENIKGSEQPLSRSVAFEKIKAGDLLLSPFATWKIKLIPHKINKNKVTHANLREFENDIDLELQGGGYYVDDDEDDRCPDLMVDKYYKSTDLYEVPNLENYNKRMFAKLFKRRARILTMNSKLT